MREISVTERLASPIEAVWDLIVDIESYPSMMEPVRELIITSGPVATGDGTEEVTASWEVELKGSILRWVEREMRYLAQYRIEYYQLEGDLDSFNGYWQLTSVDRTTTDVTLYVQFEIGIPMLADMLEPVAVRAIADNSRKMLKSLEPSADANSPGAAS